MKKGIMCLLAVVCAASFGGAAGAALAADTRRDVTADRVVYETDFSGENAGALPAGWTEISPDSYGEAAVRGGKLKLLSSGNTVESYQERLLVMLPENRFTELTNFTYEVTFTIDRTTDDNDMRFISFLYRMRDYENISDSAYGTSANTTTYYQMAVRQQATNASGVELAQKQPGAANKWSVSGRAAYSENIFPSKEYTAKIVVKNNRVSEYLNGALLITGTMPEGYENGELGLQIANMEATVSHVKVTENPPVYDYSGYCDTYRPTTGLVNPPTVVVDVTSKAIYDRIKVTNRAMPATAILHLDENLNVTNDAGQKITTFAAAMKQFSKRVIPALYLSDDAAADAVIAMAKDTNLTDAFVMSRNPALVKKVRLACKGLRGVIDYFNEVESTQDLAAIHDEVNANWAKVAVLSSGVATPEVVDYLEKRLITVWVKGLPELPDYCEAIARGANGLVAGDFSTAYTAISMYNTPNTLTRAPYIAAHRGYHKNVPENSLPAAKAAYENGADAIECDIWLTTDNQFVIAHDNDVSVLGAKKSDGSAASGHLESMTLSEVKTLRLKDGVTEIPTLEEYFQEFLEKDVLHYIEIKTTKSGWITEFKGLVEEYGVRDQIVVIIFGDYADQAARLDVMREHMPEVSIGYLTQLNAYQSNQVESFETAEEWVTKYNATYNPFYQKLTKQCAEELNDRGITCWAWTMDSAAQFKTGVDSGYNGITTNECVRAKDFVKRLIPDTHYNLDMGESNAIEVGAHALLRVDATESVGVPVQIVAMTIVAGDVRIERTADGKFYGTTAGDGKVVVAYDYEDDTGIRYRVYSEPVSVFIEQSDPDTPGESETPTDVPTENPPESPSNEPPARSGCGCGTITGGGTGGGGLFAVLCASVFALFFFKRRVFVPAKKRNK